MSMHGESSCCLLMRLICVAWGVLWGFVALCIGFGGLHIVGVPLSSLWVASTSLVILCLFLISVVTACTILLLAYESSLFIAARREASWLAIVVSWESHPDVGVMCTWVHVRLSVSSTSALEGILVLKKDVTPSSWSGMRSSSCSSMVAMIEWECLFLCVGIRSNLPSG